MAHVHDESIEAVEVTINGHVARIECRRGTYVATFLGGPYAGEEVDGVSPRRAWQALRQLIDSFDQKRAGDGQSPRAQVATSVDPG